MKYTLTNPKNGAPISYEIGGRVYELDVGETADFDELVAVQLVKTFGFLVLERSHKLGAVENLHSDLAAKLQEQDDAEKAAEEAKHCPECGQLLSEFQPVAKVKKVKKPRVKKEKKVKRK